MEKDITLFAKTNFRNKERIFGIKRKDRRQHTYIVGKTGTGKTTLLFNLAIQDIIKGEGICIVDQHGDFVETIITKIPRERIKDVVYFNPIDAEYPIGFNVLEVPDQKYKHLVASDLMAIFTKIWANVWSARMEYILNNCVLALLDTSGSTLLGIPRILTDKDYRQKIIANIKDPIVKSFWIYEYESWRDQFRNEAIVPIQNKVGQFLSTSLIRNIVGQSKSTINIQEIMNTGKILLVNLSKGKLGEDNSALLGAMMITKIQLAAMERARVPEEERKDFYLHIDEFQGFVTDSFATILSEARKYRLNLVISHQYIGQLVSGTSGGTSTKVKDAIFGNVGTMIIFRVGAADAEFLEKELEPDFNIQDMTNLPNFHIYLKLMVDGVTSRPFSAITLPPLSMASHESNREEVIEISRKNYANSLEEAEEEFSRWSGITTEKAPEKKIFGDKRPFTKRPAEQARFKYASNLGEIGIEFEAPKKVSSFEKIGRRLAGETEEEKQYLSLEELKKKETVQKTPSQPSFEKPAKKEPTSKSTIDELKEAIKKAIGKE
ncbi:MAG: type IV secretion system DNA-binding domain-containing protein [Patescibacteria group bacterium]